MIKQEGPLQVLCNGVLALEEPLTNCATLGHFLPPPFLCLNVFIWKMRIIKVPNIAAKIK